ncbi:MAG: glycosyltransferase family 2 protein [Candidatus Omnitrophica bacterium]|nr:glycosyltransferase family 2 protein [Candidatus Omnitrophota bacterium]
MKISIVLPAFNEQGNLKAVTHELGVVLKGLDYKIIFVDDGSQDNTLDALKKLRGENPRIHFLSFSRNFGHQNALKAGLDHADGDCVVVMDCDMQHPPGMLPEMIALWQKGYEVVYTIRHDKKGTPFFKRSSASLFYSILNSLSEVPIDPGRADFFLIDKKVVDVLRNYDESSLFFRGMIPWIGFKQVGLDYTPAPRLSGKTKYSFKKMFEFAVDGVTSFSIKPLRAAIFLGFFVSTGAVCYLIYILYQRLFTNLTVPGWTSILASVLLLGGIQLISLGIIGEYLGKLFMHSKKRPKYIIREKS